MPAVTASIAHATDRLSSGGNLIGALGAPTDVVGDPSLQTDPTARVRHLHRDYFATVTATQVPGSGFVVQEQFQRRPARATPPRSR
jgi:hypothetical protein